MVSGAMIPTAKKASPKASPDSALITPHTPSEETQTLKKKGLALTVPHDTSVEVSRSSMRDSNFCRFLRDLERFVLSATQNPTHICTRRLSLSSSNYFSHCLARI